MYGPAHCPSSYTSAQIVSVLLYLSHFLYHSFLPLVAIRQRYGSDTALAVLGITAHGPRSKSRRSNLAPICGLGVVLAIRLC